MSTQSATNCLDGERCTTSSSCLYTASISTMLLFLLMGSFIGSVVSSLPVSAPRAGTKNSATARRKSGTTRTRGCCTRITNDWDDIRHL
ncbi:calcium-dependent lipid-binding family protein [Trifolium repens]|nr:calcium-dependent lipid-binding family protein [Trifolium repens]